MLALKRALLPGQADAGEAVRGVAVVLGLVPLGSRNGERQLVGVVGAAHLPGCGLRLFPGAAEEGFRLVQCFSPMRCGSDLLIQLGRRVLPSVMPLTSAHTFSSPERAYPTT